MYLGVYIFLPFLFACGLFGFLNPRTFDSFGSFSAIISLKVVYSPFSL